MPDDRPPGMYRNGRLEQALDDGEAFFCRIDPEWIEPDGGVAPAHIPCPDLSSNRSKFSEPFYVLYPRERFEKFAVFSFDRVSAPRSVASDEPGGGAPVLYDVITVHDPEEDNYGHCETRFYRGSERMKPNKVSKGAKKVFRFKMSLALKLCRASNPNFPD